MTLLAVFTSVLVPRRYSIFPYSLFPHVCDAFCFLRVFSFSDVSGVPSFSSSSLFPHAHPNRISYCSRGPVTAHTSTSITARPPASGIRRGFLEDVTDRLFRNVGTQVPAHAAQQPGRAKTHLHRGSSLKLSQPSSPAEAMLCISII
jgi:hypothetical protein